MWVPGFYSWHLAKNCVFQGLNLSWVGTLKENKLTVYENNPLHVHTMPFCAHEGKDAWYKDVHVVRLLNVYVVTMYFYLV